MTILPEPDELVKLLRLTARNRWEIPPASRTHGVDVAYPSRCGSRAHRRESRVLMNQRFMRARALAHARAHPRADVMGRSGQPDRLSPRNRWVFPSDDDAVLQFSDRWERSVPNPVSLILTRG